MSQFDELAKAQLNQPQASGQGVGYPGVPINQPPREMNLTERVMTHDQRIMLLEKVNAELTQNVERLAQLLVDQLGLQIR